MYGLLVFLIYGVVYIGIIGRIVSVDDEFFFRKVIRDFYCIKNFKVKSFCEYKDVKFWLKG